VIVLQICQVPSVTVMSKTSVEYTHAEPACTGDQETCLVHTTLTAKMHIHLRKHARATVQQTLRHANHCEPSCNLSSARLKRLPESMATRHGAAAAAFPYRNHLILCLGAGPIQFVYDMHSKLGHGAYPSKNYVSTFVPAGFHIQT